MVLTFAARGAAARIEAELVSEDPAFRLLSGGPWVNAVLGEVCLLFEPASLGPRTACLRWRAIYGPGEPGEEDYNSEPLPLVISE